MKRVVMFSGGVGSYATAQSVADQYGSDDLVLLFADTRMEDEDLYRFIDEAAALVGGELVTVADGRDVWEVFFDVRFLGNSRIDPCSRILKRELLRRWLDDECDPQDTTVYLGIDWTEIHRFERARPYWAPWAVEAPLTEPPLRDRDYWHDRLAAGGVALPRLYELGFPHNNCGGFCVKAGQAQFDLLLRRFPERYAWHEERERALQQHLGKDVTILRDWANGGVPMSLRQFRERRQAQTVLFDREDWGGCACFTPDDYHDDV